MTQVAEEELRRTHPPINGVSSLQAANRCSLLTLFLHLPGDDGDVSHSLVLCRPVPQRRHVNDSPRLQTLVMVVFLPERQVQSAVFVLQQLFHREHGGSQHVHLEKQTPRGRI